MICIFVVTTVNNLFYFLQELLNAVVYGDKEIIQLCLKKGANINYQGRVSCVKIEELNLINFFSLLVR